MMLRKVRPALSCSPFSHSRRTTASCALVEPAQLKEWEYGPESAWLEGGALSSASFDASGGGVFVWREFFSQVLQLSERSFQNSSSKLLDAKRCFGEVWTLSKQGQFKEALYYLQLLDKRGLTLLQQFASTKALTLGKHILTSISESGLASNVFLANSLLKVHMKCGNVVGARQMFDRMLDRDVISWTAMISGYAQHGNGEEALNLFRQMHQENVEPNNVTFSCALKACTGLLSLDQGKEVHAGIIKSALETDVFVGSCLVDMYAKCGSIQDSVQVFQKMTSRNVVSWTALIAGYAQHGLGDAALKLFQQMQYEKVTPNEVTYASALNACRLVGSLEQGKEIHKGIVEHGFESDLFLGNTLIDMYVKCGSIESARQAFDKMVNHDVVSWNLMMAGYVHQGHCEEALKLFLQMLEKSVAPDKGTLISALKACAYLNALEVGQQIHSSIDESGIDLDVFLGSTLVDMYAKCGSLETARKVFNMLPEQDAVAWTAMISGYSQHGHGEEALKLFRKMQLQKVSPDKFAFVSALNACARISALQEGKQIHADILESGCQADLCVASALVDMYVKCGSLSEAQEVFDAMTKRDVVSWNAMIAGYAHHGDSDKALRLFEQMRGDGVKMDHVTFLSTLLACSHGGLVDEGRRFFDSMATDHGIKPAVEHHTCMVDLFGRAGHLEEAESFMKKMQCQPNAAMWTSLLSACRTYGNVELAKHVVQKVHELEPKNAAASVLLAESFTGSNRFDDKAKVRQLMESRGLKKEPGWSRIEIRGQLFTFLVDDMSHPQSKEIRVELQRLLKIMKEGGYDADVRFVLRDIPENQKENALLHHSERLAMALGHLELPPRAPLRVIKNLRVCGDCHTATKYFSKIMQREIIVRDATRFHHFKDGVCSCGDYW